MKKTLSMLLVGVFSLGFVSTASAANDFPQELFDAVEETVELTIAADEYMSDAEKEFVLAAFDFFAEGTSIFSGDIEVLFGQFLAVEGIELTDEETKMLANLFDIYRNEKEFIQRAIWAGYWSEMEFSSDEELEAIKPLLSVLSSHYLEMDIADQPRDIEKLMEEIEEEGMALDEKYAYLDEDPALQSMALKIFMGSTSSGIFMSDFENLLTPGFSDWDEDYNYDQYRDDSNIQEVKEASDSDEEDFWRDDSYQWIDEDQEFDWEGGVEREVHPDYTYQSSTVPSLDRTDSHSSRVQPINRRASVKSVGGNRKYRGARINRDRMVYPKTNDRGYITQ